MSAWGRGAREKRHTGSAGSGPAFRRMSAVTDVTRVLGHPAVGGAGTQGTPGTGQTGSADVSSRLRTAASAVTAGSPGVTAGSPGGHGGVPGVGVARGGRRETREARRERGTGTASGSSRLRPEVGPVGRSARPRAPRGMVGVRGPRRRPRGGPPVLPEAAPWRVSPAPRSVTDSAAAGRETGVRRLGVEVEILGTSHEYANEGS